LLTSNVSVIGETYSVLPVDITRNASQRPTNRLSPGRGGTKHDKCGDDATPHG